MCEYECVNTFAARKLEILLACLDKSRVRLFLSNIISVSRRKLYTRVHMFQSDTISVPTLQLCTSLIEALRAVSSDSRVRKL
jgi:hypothetical protein